VPPSRRSGTLRRTAYRALRSGQRSSQIHRETATRVHVRLAAPLSRLASSARLQIEVDDGATVGSVLRRLADEQPDLAASLPAALTVVHGNQAGRDHVLADGDEVAFLTPVAGG
jgi:molybdopterin converting factor small subunit